MSTFNAGHAAAITRALHAAGATGVTSECWNGNVVIEARFADLASVRNVLLDKGYDATVESTPVSSETVWITVVDQQRAGARIHR